MFQGFYIDINPSPQPLLVRVLDIWKTAVVLSFFAGTIHLLKLLIGWYKAGVVF